MNAKLKSRLRKVWIFMVGAFALIGFSVTAVSSWALWQFAGTSSKELSGEQAEAEIRRWFKDGEKPALSDARAFFSRTGFPADPAYFYRFSGPKETVERLVARYQLKQMQPDARMLGEMSEKFGRYRRRQWSRRDDSWWRPEISPATRYYLGDQNGNFFYLIYDEATGVCHLHIQNT